jgi:hypothetical protein
MEKQRIKKQSNCSKQTRQENAEYKPATTKKKPYQLRSLNLLKTLGHHVHLQ